MQIITDDYILLSHNILSIYTNIEKFIDAVDTAVKEGLVSITPKEKADLHNYLSMKACKPGSTFLGIFFTIDPLGFEIETCWFLLNSVEKYRMLLSAMENNSNFDMSSQDVFDERYNDEGFEVTTLVDDQDYADYLEDEYDLELEVDLDNEEFDYDEEDDDGEESSTSC